MARIPDSEIERLKKEIAIERLVMGFGVELKRHGAGDLIGTCPFHVNSFCANHLQIPAQSPFWNPVSRGGPSSFGSASGETLARLASLAADDPEL